MDCSRVLKNQYDLCNVDSVTNVCCLHTRVLHTAAAAAAAAVAGAAVMQYESNVSLTLYCSAASDDMESWHYAPRAHSVFTQTHMYIIIS